MNEYIYGVYDECGGLFGLWTDETKAHAEVDRLSKLYFSDDIREEDWFTREWAYGNNMVYCERVRVNWEWGKALPK